MIASPRFIFNTKFNQNSERNGQECWIIEVSSVAADSSHDLVKVRFGDGYIAECYRVELDATTNLKEGKKNG